MPIADAVTRETAWLNTYDPADGLPALVQPAGPWGKIQAYVPRVENQRLPAVYVLRPKFRTVRFANVRSMTTHNFMLKLVWPLANATGSAETEFQNFENAVGLLLKRIFGLLLDKTHGGRFLSVAEEPSFVNVEYEDPDVTIPNAASLFGVATYSADDSEFSN